MKKGDVVLVPFPFTDLSGKKLRPAAILAVIEKEVIVAFITSQLNIYKTRKLSLKASERTGLKKDSLLLLDKISTLDKSLIVGKLGQLSKQEVENVNKNLRELFNL